MKIRILFFGIARDLANNNWIALEVNKDSRVTDILDLLQEKYQNFKNVREFSIAVNEKYTENTFVLKENDVVAIIPPVSGG